MSSFLSQRFVFFSAALYLGVGSFVGCGGSQTDLVVREIAHLPEIHRYSLHRMSLPELRSIARDAEEGGDLRSTRLLLEEIVNRVPDDQAALEKLLDLSKRMDRPQETVGWLFALIDVNPKHGPYYIELARLLMSLGNVQLAAEVWQRYFELRSLNTLGDSV